MDLQRQKSWQSETGHVLGSDAAYNAARAFDRIKIVLGRRNYWAVLLSQHGLFFREWAKLKETLNYGFVCWLNSK